MRVAPLRMAAKSMEASTTPRGWVLPKQRNRDGIKAIAGREAQFMAIIQASHFNCASQTCQHARERHGDDDGSGHVDSGIFGGIRVGAGGADLKTEGGFPKQPPDQDGDQQRQNKTPVNTQPRRR